MTGSLLKLIILLLFIFNSFVFSSSKIALSSSLEIGNIVVPNDKKYYKHKLSGKNIEIIYTKDNIQFAKDTETVQDAIQNSYENFFNWKLDDTLYVGLISNNNQIADGFSSQWPNNRQINYIGGSSSVDYFSNTSWLNILLYHETAHNYQTNVKASIVSRTLYYIFGNGTFLLPTYLTVPGSGANSFMLEGNAVLNESWHGSGGRLYSGRFKAMTILQAKAKNIKASYMYNNRLAFPYTGGIYYQIGGFYNLYMAKNYTLKNINRYFFEKTKDWWWPFYTNSSMKKAVGISFEDSLENFSSEYTKMAKKLVIAKGEKIASSQFYTQLSSDKYEIFFITNESGYREPELIVIDKKSEKLSKVRDSWIPSKVIKVGKKYYTQASKNTSVTKITQGLYNRNAFIKEGTESKVIQGYLSDYRAVYFDVSSSFDYPKLYIGNEYYGQTNSSVFIDKNDNIYYFINKNGGKTRTLYKNRQALYSYQGFYGIVADVDAKGTVYFIANSKFGSTLYKYKNAKVTRVSSADNILEARLLSKDKVLLSAVSQSDYYYVKTKLEDIKEEPYDTKLFFENRAYYGRHKNNNSIKTKDINISNPYEAFLDMHYSGSDLSLILDNNILVGTINANFGDTLSQNTANIFLNRDESNVTILGVGYSNSKYILEYNINTYVVVDKSKSIKSRDNGLMASLKYKLYKSGYYDGYSKITYFQDYNTLAREPLTANFSFSRSESYGISMYNNYLNAINIYGVKEREDEIYGFSYDFEHDLGDEFYLKIGAKYSKTTSNISQKSAFLQTRGVKISPISYQTDMDLSTIVMPSINSYIYIKGVKYADLSLFKVINLSSYFFTFPLSLQRESIYAKYRYYEVETFNSNIEHEKVNEVMLGARFDTIFLNIVGPLALSFDFYHNDNKKFASDTDKFIFSIGGKF